MSCFKQRGLLWLTLGVGLLAIVVMLPGLANRMNLNRALIACVKFTHLQPVPCPLAISSQDVCASYHLGLNALRAGALPKAIGYLSEHIAKDPKDQVAGFYLGMAYRQNGNEALTLDAWRKAGAGPFFFLRGSQLGSVDDLQTAIALGENKPATFYELGNVLLGAGRSDEARRVFEQGLALDTKNTSEAWLTRGKIAELDGDWQSAIEMFRHALLLQPQSFEAYIKIAELYRRNTQDKQTPLAEYQACIENTRYMWCYLGAAEMYRDLGKLDNASKLVDQAREGAPNNPFPLLAMGQIWELRGNLDQARTFYLEAARLDSSIYWSYYYLGGLAMRKGDWQEAIVQYRHVVELIPFGMGEYPAPWGVKLGKAQTGLWNIPRRSAARQIYSG